MREKIRAYIKMTFKITDEEIDQDRKIWTKNILCEVQRNNDKLRRMKKEKEEKAWDLHFLENSTVSGVSYGNESGHNTGGKPNNQELKLIRICDLSQEIASVINEIIGMEKSLKDNNQLIEDWIWDAISNKEHASIMIDKWIDHKSNSEQERERPYYGYNYIPKILDRCLEKMSKTL